MTPNGWPSSIRSIRPGTTGTRGEALADGRRVEADRLAEGDDRQRVVDVEPPDQLEVDGRRARRRVVGDPEAARVLLDARRADVGGGVGAVGQDPGAGLLGDADEGAGRRVVGVDDPGRRPAERLGGLARLARAAARRASRTGAAWRRGTPPTCRGARGARGSGWSGSRRRRRSRRRASSARPCDVVSMTAAVSPASDHRAERALERRAPRASSRAPRSAAWTPPIRVAAVPVIPVRMPGRLERRDGQERGRRLAVRAGDPDDRQVVARVAVPPGGGAGEGRPRVGRRRAAASATLGERLLDERGRGPGRRGRRDEVVAVDVEPGDRHEQRARRGPSRESLVTPRTAMPARPAGPIARPSRRAPRSRPLAGQPLDQPAERRPARSVRRPRGARRSVAARSSADHPRRRGSASRPDPVAAGVVDPLVGAGQLEPAPAERALVLVEAVQRVALASVRRGRRRRPRHRGPSRRIPRGSRAGWPASAAGGARPGCVVRVAAWSPEWTVERRPPCRYRIETGQRLAGGVAGARLEVDEVAGRERGAPPGDEPGRAGRTRSGAARRSRAGGRRSGRGRPRRARRARRTRPRRPSGPSRASWRTTATPAFSAPRIRCRVDLAIAVEDGRLVGARPERQRDPVARRLDLLDRRGSRPPRSRRGTPVRGRAPRGRRRRRRPPRPASASPIATSRAARPAGPAPIATGPRGT